MQHAVSMTYSLLVPIVDNRIPLSNRILDFQQTYLFKRSRDCSELAQHTTINKTLQLFQRIVIRNKVDGSAFEFLLKDVFLRNLHGR